MGAIQLFSKNVSEAGKFHTFVNLALFMAAITGIELVIIFIPFANWITTTAIVFLSVVKFFGVIFWFMHLTYDKALLTFTFLSALVIAAGTVTALLVLHGGEKTIPIGGEEEISSVQRIEDFIAV